MGLFIICGGAYANFITLRQGRLLEYFFTAALELYLKNVSVWGYLFLLLIYVGKSSIRVIQCSGNRFLDPADSLQLGDANLI